MDKLTEEFDQLQSLTKAEQMVALAKFLYTEMGERASPRLREITPVARGSQRRRDSRNLGSTLSPSPVLSASNVFVSVRT